MFKLDFKTIIMDICSPYHHLKEGIIKFKSSKLFPLILSLTKDIGNTLNNSSIQSFTLDSLLKLSLVKDSDKRSLLYFIVKTASGEDNSPVTENLTEVLESWSHVVRTDFDEIDHNLKLLEMQCKNALGPRYYIYFSVG